MLNTLYPRIHSDYESMPVIGSMLNEFCVWLDKCGYPPVAIRSRVRGSRHIANVLRRRRIRSLRGLTAQSLWAIAPQPTSWAAHIARASLRSWTLFLQETGVLASAPTTPLDECIGAYCRHLATTRGLAPRTIVKHKRRVIEFLHFLGYDGNHERLRRLRDPDVEAFVRYMGQRLGRASMQAVVAALRSLFKFLATEGVVSPHLGAHIDSPRCFRDERLPRALPWKTVRALLRAVDRSTPKGRRDYAILLMAASYGLRSSEIAAVSLDDVSWRSRVIRVPRPKVGSPLSLPLTDDVALALHEYLRQGRPRSSHREIFLRVRFPLVPITSNTVNDVFDAWAARAGIRLPFRAGGPHCLRHSVAVHLLQRGASTKTIGDLLGHRSAESTSVYLRLQIDDLREVSIPLPTMGRQAVRP
jgi:site-specific recombinase XerD